jgi:hypothetical protein
MAYLIKKFVAYSHKTKFIWHFIYCHKFVIL